MADILSTIPDISAVGVDAVKDWSSKLPSYGEKQFNGTKANRMASPKFWQDRVVYQVFPDRFNNADASNDGIIWNENQFNQMGPTGSQELKDVLNYRHGGDLKGITERLDYIKEMGVGALYINSFLTNNNGDYHGYCVSNFLEVDPNFGTLEELQHLVAEAHARDIMVIMDFVVNHMCDKNTGYQGGAPAYEKTVQCSEGHFAESEKVMPGSGTLQDQTPLNFGDTFFGPLKEQSFFSRCGKLNFNTETEATSIYGDFAEPMFDFNTNNENMMKLLTDFALYWIAAADVDAFRVDAAKHVSQAFVAYFCTTVREYAQSIGKDNFYIVGEFVGSPDNLSKVVGPMNVKPEDPRFTLDSKSDDDITLHARSIIISLKEKYLSHEYQKYPGFTGVYDFPLSTTARDTFRGQTVPNSLQLNWQAPDRTKLASIVDDSLWWQWLDQHDWERFFHPIDDSGTNKVSAEMGKCGQAYLLTSKAIPIIYYGFEQGLTGFCNPNTVDIEVGNQNTKNIVTADCQKRGPDAHKRQTMWSQGSYSLGSVFEPLNEFAFIGRPKGQNPYGWETDPFLNRENEIFKEVRRLLAIRNACGAMRRGEQHFYATIGRTISYSRYDEDMEILIVINGQIEGELNKSYTLQGKVDQASIDKKLRYMNLLNEVDPYIGTYERLDGDAAQLATKNLTLAPYEVMILVREDFVGEDWNDSVGSFLCEIKHVPPPATKPPVVTNDPTLMIVLGVTLGLFLSCFVGYRLTYARHWKKMQEKEDKIKHLKSKNKGKRKANRDRLVNAVVEPNGSYKSTPPMKSSSSGLRLTRVDELEAVPESESQV